MADVPTISRGSSSSSSGTTSTTSDGVTIRRGTTTPSAPRITSDFGAVYRSSSNDQPTQSSRRTPNKTYTVHIKDYNIEDAQQAMNQIRYTSAVNNEKLAAKIRQTNLSGQIEQLKLQVTQLPETLKLLEQQYSESLGLVNRLQESTTAISAQERQNSALQQKLDWREFQKKVGATEASIGARGLGYQASAMADIQRQAAMLKEIQAGQDALFGLEEQRTGIKFDQQRNELEDQIQNSRLSVGQKLEAVQLDLKNTQEQYKLAGPRFISTLEYRNPLELLNTPNKFRQFIPDILGMYNKEKAAFEATGQYATYTYQSKAEELAVKERAIRMMPDLSTGF